MYTSMLPVWSTAHLQSLSSTRRQLKINRIYCSSSTLFSFTSVNLVTVLIQLDHRIADGIQSFPDVLLIANNYDDEVVGIQKVIRQPFDLLMIHALYDPLLL